MFVFSSPQLTRFAMFGGALAVATLIGFFMQLGQTAPVQNPTPVESERKARAEVFAPVQEKASQQLEQTPTMIKPVMATQLAPIMPTSVENASLAPENHCTENLLAASGAAALIDVILTAPCYSDQWVIVHHEGMMFSQRLDANGKITFKVPALKLSSFIMVSFEDGTTKSVEVDTPSLEFYERVVLQWEGPAGLQFHAFEYGAGYGEPGHIWSGTPRKVSDAAAGDGGFLLMLGDDQDPKSLRAEVYTFPSGITHKTGAIEMTVEAEISAANCSQDIGAQTLQFKAENRLLINDLTLNVPGCDAIGEFLVLNNLVETMKLAIN